jgi:hypothetical protein
VSTHDLSKPCAGHVAGSGFRPRRCSRAGLYEYKGLWFCNAHHPPEKTARAQQRHKEFQNKWDKEKAEKAERHAMQIETQRRAAAFDVLYAALLDCVKVLEIDLGLPSVATTEVVRARAALAAARGES